MKARLQEMQMRHPSMGDVRGQGMLMAIEFVRDRDSKERISGEEAEQLYHELVTRGVLVSSASPIMRVTPPLLLSKELADRGLDIFDEAITAFEHGHHLG
jgi:4-aminobutyrate aminotransferase-like enzyme